MDKYPSAIRLVVHTHARNVRHVCNELRGHETRACLTIEWLIRKIRVFKTVEKPLPGENGRTIQKRFQTFHLNSPHVRVRTLRAVSRKLFVHLALHRSTGRFSHSRWINGQQRPGVYVLNAFNFVVRLTFETSISEPERPLNRNGHAPKAVHAFIGRNGWWTSKNRSKTPSPTPARYWPN